MKTKNLTEGIVKRHPDGFGFLIPDDPNTPDVYVPRSEMQGVMTNDRVRARAAREKDGRLRAEQVEVTGRAIKNVLGRYHMAVDGGGVLYDEGHGWGCPVYIRRDKSGGAKPDNWVAVRILTYPDNQGSKLTGEVVGVITDIEDPLNDIKRVLFAHGIPQEWNSQVASELKKLPDEVE